MSNDIAVAITDTANMSTHTTLSSALQTAQTAQPTVDSAAVDMKAVVQAAQTMSIKEQEEEEDQENAGVGAANAQLNLVRTHCTAGGTQSSPAPRSGDAAAMTTEACLRSDLL